MREEAKQCQNAAPKSLARKEAARGILDWDMTLELGIQT